MPGVSEGTMIMECRWYGGLSGSVMTMAMMNDDHAAHGRKPFLAVDDPLVTVELGVAGELLRIGAGLRLGH